MIALPNIAESLIFSANKTVVSNIFRTFLLAPPLQIALTVEMSCRYLRGAREDVLCALGRVVHLGKHIVVAEADILVDGILQYTTSGTYTLMPRSPQGTADQDQGVT